MQTTAKEKPGARLLNAFLALVLALGICIPTAALSATVAYAAENTATIKSITVGGNPVNFTSDEASGELAVIPVTVYTQPNYTGLRDIVITFDGVSESGEYSWGTSASELTSGSGTLSSSATAKQDAGLIQWNVSNNQPLFVKVANEESDNSTFELTFTAGNTANDITNVSCGGTSMAVESPGASTAEGAEPAINIELPNGTDLEQSQSVTLTVPVTATVKYGTTSGSINQDANAVTPAEEGSEYGTVTIESVNFNSNASLYVEVISQANTSAYYQFTAKASDIAPKLVSPITVGGQEAVYGTATSPTTPGAGNATIGTPTALTVTAAWPVALSDSMSVVLNGQNLPAGKDVLWAVGESAPSGINEEGDASNYGTNDGVAPVEGVITLTGVNLTGKNELFVALPNGAQNSDKTKNYVYYQITVSASTDPGLNSLTVNGLTQSDPTGSTTINQGTPVATECKLPSTAQNADISFKLLAASDVVVSYLVADSYTDADGSDDWNSAETITAGENGAYAINETYADVNGKTIYIKVAPAGGTLSTSPVYYALSIAQTASGITEAPTLSAALTQGSPFNGTTPQEVTLTLGGTGVTQWPKDVTEVSWTLDPAYKGEDYTFDEAQLSGTWDFVVNSEQKTAVYTSQDSNGTAIALIPGKYTFTVNFGSAQLGDNAWDIWTDPVTTAEAMEVSQVSLTSAAVVFDPETSTLSYTGAEQGLPKLGSVRTSAGSWLLAKEWVSVDFTTGPNGAENPGNLFDAGDYGYTVSPKGQGWAYLTDTATGNYVVQKAAAPTVSIAPENLYLAAGDTATFTVTVSGVLNETDLEDLTVKLKSSGNESYYTFDPEITDSDGDPLTGWTPVADAQYLQWTTEVTPTATGSADLSFTIPETAGYAESSVSSWMVTVGAQSPEIVKVDPTEIAFDYTGVSGSYTFTTTDEQSFATVTVTTAGFDETTLLTVTTSGPEGLINALMPVAGENGT